MRVTLCFRNRGTRFAGSLEILSGKTNKGIPCNKVPKISHNESTKPIHLLHIEIKSQKK